MEFSVCVPAILDDKRCACASGINAPYEGVLPVLDIAEIRTLSRRSTIEIVGVERQRRVSFHRSCPAGHVVGPTESLVHDLGAALSHVHVQRATHDVPGLVDLGGRIEVSAGPDRAACVQRRAIATSGVGEGEIGPILEDV